ncbi:MAG: helix-turn-helix domain-containing protein [Chloroflexi bacterium]|nr:helix-turn-helix domain-containing protein [Chloroflexota bacterium]
MDRLLTLVEVAAALHVHVNTVRRLVYSGRLTAIRISPRGDLRVRPADLEQFMTKASV